MAALWNAFSSLASPALYGERSDRHTLCVSSQVGCAFACKFCASGLDGFTRNLTPEEIAGQVLLSEELSGKKINNIVFMGMGEPLANLSHLLKSIELITSPWGIGIGARHLTISTSGLVPQIRKLADHPQQIRLAISLHGATDEVRERIMPINNKWPLSDLFDALRYWMEKKKQKITLEYILIEGVNDELKQAELLVKRARSDPGQGKPDSLQYGGRPLVESTRRCTLPKVPRHPQRQRGFRHPAPRERTRYRCRLRTAPPQGGTVEHTGVRRAPV